MFVMFTGQSPDNFFSVLKGNSFHLLLRLEASLGEPVGVFHNRNPSNLDSDLDSLD